MPALLRRLVQQSPSPLTEFNKEVVVLTFQLQARVQQRDRVLSRRHIL